MYYERKFKKQGYCFIAGVDEAGVGPLAGPVVAAAVLLKKQRFKSRIDDSKKLSASQRHSAFLEIIRQSFFGIGIINEKVIDRVNIFQASRIAMEEAIHALLKKLEHDTQSGLFFLVDGRVKPEIPLPFVNIIRGDAKSKSIACASILAKVTRDRLMDIYDKVYPQYGFKSHKGYPTSAHRRAVKHFGRSAIHRKSFHCG